MVISWANFELQRGKWTCKGVDSGTSFDVDLPAGEKDWVDYDEKVSMFTYPSWLRQHSFRHLLMLWLLLKRAAGAGLRVTDAHRLTRVTSAQRYQWT